MAALNGPRGADQVTESRRVREARGGQALTCGILV